MTVSFRLKEDTVWGKRGHEVAFGQGVYEVEAPAKAEKPAKFEVIRSNHDFGVRGENFDVMFSDLNGGLVSYRYGGVEMIKMIPKPNFWRAPRKPDADALQPVEDCFDVSVPQISERQPLSGTVCTGNRSTRGLRRSQLPLCNADHTGE